MLRQQPGSHGGEIKGLPFRPTSVYTKVIVMFTSDKLTINGLQSVFTGPTIIFFKNWSFRNRTEKHK